MRPLRITGSLTRFAASVSGVAAIEAAIILPMFVVFMLGGGEIARFINTSRRVTNVANSLATLIAERSSDMTYNDAVFVFNSTMVSFPLVLQDSSQKQIAWYSDIKVTISSIKFTPTQQGCVSSCTYSAAVVWSVNSPVASTRSCKVAPVPVADTDAPSLTTLPQDVYRAGTLIVVDVSYVYTPDFGVNFIGATTLKRSVYLQPRYVPAIKYTGSNC